MKDDTSKRIDPDPFVISTLILAAVSTAASVYSAVNGTIEGRRRSRDRRSQQLAAIHRWEADLHDIRHALDAMKEFILSVDTSSPENSADLVPFIRGMFLNSRQFQELRRLQAQLLRCSQSANTSAFTMLEMVDSAGWQSYLAQHVQTMRQHLSELKRINEPEQQIEIANQAINHLIDVATFLRKETV